MTHPLPLSTPEHDTLSAADSDSKSRAIHLLGLGATRLRDWLSHTGQPGYRSDQILNWIYNRRAEHFAAMTNLPKTLRTWLGQNARLYRTRLIRTLASSDGTQKLLLASDDGASIETVWIPADPRNTACLSSQVGCPVGCRFCASGIGGVQRNLEAGEIVEQALRVDALVRATRGRDARLSHIVMMGMGEPLANYDQVIRAIRIFNASWGLGIGARRITVSTVGLPKQIRRLADEGLQLNLALSLHAPDDRLRAKLIPWARGISIADLIDACAHYFDRTGREVTLEYVMLAGVNMQPAHATRLAEIARRLSANVNLLRYNPVPGLPFDRPDAESSYLFQRRLRNRGVSSHIRTSRGRDVAAACGQLRRTHEQAENTS